LEAISTAELWIGPDCEVLHRTGDVPREAVPVLLAYCDTVEGRYLRRWLGVHHGPDVVDRLFSPLEDIAEALQELRKEVVDLDGANVSAVDYPDEDFWIRVVSIEECWNRVRERAQSARSCLVSLFGKSPTVLTGRG
jgi:hypothetical protein